MKHLLILAILLICSVSRADAPPSKTLQADKVILTFVSTDSKRFIPVMRFNRASNCQWIVESVRYRYSPGGTFTCGAESKTQPFYGMAGKINLLLNRPGQSPLHFGFARNQDTCFELAEFLHKAWVGATLRDFSCVEKAQ